MKENKKIKAEELEEVNGGAVDPILCPKKPVDIPTPPGGFIFDKKDVDDPSDIHQPLEGKER